jgi:tetratricopeptide (TPR) repeat protein
MTIDALLEQLAAEPRRAGRRQLLDGPEGNDPGTVTRLYDETVRLARVDLRRAARLAETAEWLSRKLKDDASRATGLRAAGHIHLLHGRHAAALERYRAALEINERLGRDLDVARTMSGGALQALIYLGRYDEAFEWAERARAVFIAHNSPIHLARLDGNMANVLYRQDRFEEALALYRRALDVFAQANMPQDAAVTLRNTATCQISLNDFRGALETYRKAGEYCAAHEMLQLAAEADYNIAYLYYLRGEYTRAIELYRAARKRCAEIGDGYHEGLCDLDQSDICLELNLIDEGAERAARALETFQKLKMRYEAAKSIANLAMARSRSGESRAALRLFRKAREWFAREGNQAWTATIDLYQALVFYDQGLLEEAQELCERALSFFEQSPLAARAALCRLLEARIHLQASQLHKARASCAAARPKLEQAETPALTYQALFLEGSIAEALGETGPARELYRKAHACLESLRGNLLAEEMKIAFLKDKLAVYESLVGISLAPVEQRMSPTPVEAESAFLYIEQAKSRSLADSIALRDRAPWVNQNAKRGEGESAGRIRELREQLNWYTRGMRLVESGSETFDLKRLDELRRSARDCERRLAEVSAEVIAESVAESQAGGIGVSHLDGERPISAERIRAGLPEDAALVEYYRVKDRLCACILSRGGMRFAWLGSASHLRGVLNLLRYQLSKMRLGTSPDGCAQAEEAAMLAAAKAHLREFYRQLIAPIAAQLDAAHLIIAPHEFLHRLPYHALLDGDDYLGDRFTISYAPSASVYHLCAAACAETGAGIACGDRSLVMGVPDAAAPLIHDEVAAVASALPGAEVFEGAAATLDALRARGAASRYIHIATHGRFRQDNPLFSSISLGDCELSLLDLYQMSLPAELVALSGCGTGLNAVVGADELLGLVRGLLYAGARSALVTLWDVNDRSTAEFMGLFYERLRRAPDKTNPNKARAMQEAMREIRQSYKHPFYWAPFLLVGKYL